MENFTFRLDRVMDWRRTQTRIEQAKLEQLFRELQNIDAREDALLAQRTESEQELLTESGTTGFELAALDAFRQFTVAERFRLGATRRDCRKRIALQMQVVAGKRREVRLLEKLREQRLKSWQAELGRDVDRQADEAYLARWPLTNARE
jgi:flagellar export protein FliJ